MKIKLILSFCAALVALLTNQLPIELKCKITPDVRDEAPSPNKGGGF